MIRRSTVFGLVLLAFVASPARADIYAFVDEEGRAHFSDQRLDPRYKLYMKTKAYADPAPAQAQAAPSSIRPSILDAKGPVIARPTPLKAHKRYADMVSKVAKEHRLEPALLHAVITVESGYNPTAKSPKGAMGLMQVMPATGKRYGVTKLTDPLENIRAGARYLRDLISMFDNNLQLVLAAYNAGEGSVIRSGNAIPNYPETRKYVPRVLQYYESYKAQAS
ncbi:MAG TPA: lytic transglycosylase domain-containing protein [Burkholderiales bacterium]|nr:lytic transglycosylase domain-containing protein [Burkholderiales bacterium]